MVGKAFPSWWSLQEIIDSSLKTHPNWRSFAHMFWVFSLKFFVILHTIVEVQSLNKRATRGAICLLIIGHAAGGLGRPATTHVRWRTYGVQFNYAWVVGLGRGRRCVPRFRSWIFFSHRYFCRSLLLRIISKTSRELNLWKHSIQNELKISFKNVSRRRL